MAYSRTWIRRWVMQTRNRYCAVGALLLQSYTNWKLIVDESRPIQDRIAAPNLLRRLVVPSSYPYSWIGCFEFTSSHVLQQLVIVDVVVEWEMLGLNEILCGESRNSDTGWLAGSSHYSNDKRDMPVTWAGRQTYFLTTKFGIQSNDEHNKSESHASKHIAGHSLSF